jgi:hypothetical protein
VGPNSASCGMTLLRPSVLRKLDGDPPAGAGTKAISALTINVHKGKIRSNSENLSGQPCVSPPQPLPQDFAGRSEAGPTRRLTLLERRTSCLNLVAGSAAT